MLTTLDAIAATMLPMLPSFFHPATTLPQWIAWLIVCFTVWAHRFVRAAANRFAACPVTCHLTWSVLCVSTTGAAQEA